MLESQITRHERLEEGFWVKMENKLDALEAKVDTKFDALEQSIDTLRNRRARDNGFIGGIIFILSGIAAVIGAALGYLGK